MNELADLYQRVIIEHNRNPRHFHRLEPCTHHATGYNPLCGDEVRVYLRVENGHVQQAAFQGESCAIATASASLLSEVLPGLPVPRARALVAEVIRLVNEGDSGDSFPGDLGVLGAVSRFPGRNKCAELPWKALEAALDNDHEASVSTE
ncbi:MAG: SUF system NifU family Fe-S cluster assembly protein [Ectothiorhodospiraceae bacterium]|nr:SUF system NifU family Fe-S cluster assembly protein [Ectothiorhodospiraceae bacterium]